RAKYYGSDPNSRLRASVAQSITALTPFRGSDPNSGIRWLALLRRVDEARRQRAARAVVRSRRRARLDCACGAHGHQRHRLAGLDPVLDALRIGDARVLAERI